MHFADTKMLKGKWKVLSAVLAVILGSLCLGLIAFKAQRSQSVALPYTTTQELVSDINNLPECGTPFVDQTQFEWGYYIPVAKRIRQTNPILVNSALKIFSDSHKGFRQDAKIMLLLRICFRFPSGTKLPPSYGGWLSESARRAGKTNFDANWPVGKAFGQYYLQDTIGGYSGPPYDPAREFNWMLAHQVTN